MTAIASSILIFDFLSCSLVEELLSIQMQNADAVKFTSKDVIEVENSLSDILVSIPHIVQLMKVMIVMHMIFASIQWCLSPNNLLR